MANVKSFRQRIQRDIKLICEEQSLDYSSSADKGEAFQYWSARIIAEHELGLGNDDDSAVVGGPNDLEIDLFFESDTDDRVVICQCKFTDGKSRTVEDEYVHSFFSLPERLKNPEWVSSSGSTLIRDVLGDPSRFFDGSRSVTLRFITNGDYSASVRSAYPADETDSVTRELWSLSDLKQFVERGESIVRQIPKSVILDLPHERYIEVQQPNTLHKGGKAVIAVLKTNAVAQLYEQYKEAIYEQNIRRHLPKSDINAEIRKTLQKSPEKFFYFNNGISAICARYEIDDNHRLTAEELQIINGTQTLLAIWGTVRQPDSQVLFRLTEVESVATQSGFNADIIRYNNTQNEIKDYDFRSNDEIQRWLERRCKEATWPYKALKKRVRYVRKRGGTTRAKRNEVTLRLDEVAKIRYSWREDPHTIARPNVLYQASADGKYALAFGVGGKIVEAWTDEAFEETLLAIWMHLRLRDWEKLTKKAATSDANLNWLTGHHWHFLALAGEVARKEEWDVGDLLRSESGCDDRFFPFIDRAWPAVMEAERRRAEEQKQSWRDWRQSEVMWDRLRSEVIAGVERDITQELVQRQMRRSEM